MADFLFWWVAIGAVVFAVWANIVFGAKGVRVHGLGYGWLADSIMFSVIVFLMMQFWPFIAVVTYYEWADS